MSDDPRLELRFALAEGDAIDPSFALRQRVLAAAADARSPGRAVDAPQWITGVEAFRRAVTRLDDLLGDLAPAEWSHPALRDLDVQGLVGHLIGVEQAFGAALDGEIDERDHVSSTQPIALRQRGRTPVETHREWFESVTASIAQVTELDPATPTSFYGVVLPLDDMLVVRAFEMWIHDEDIRRATARPLATPDPERLARMVGLVTTLLPGGIARAGQTHAGTARLVLTGSAGGTWDIGLDGGDVSRKAQTLIVVDAVQFCRIVGARENQVSAGAVVSGDPTVAERLLLGAAALALD
ncbi:MAG TPA: maleylpyruvate isomerase family mycothiol-dependent enzyme [Acidimicrobiales bacterium]|jgi:uncharacterized protein (TIGR03083 family)